MFNTKLFGLIQKSMDGSSLRHAAISSNIANENTPGYKRLDVNFQKVLANAVSPRLDIKKTNPKHLSAVKSLDDKELFAITREDSTTMRNDGNNVDIDMETAALAENNLLFNGLAQLLSIQIGLLRQSISEGRR